MRALLIVIAVVVVIGAVVVMATSVRWQGDPSQSDLGPSEAQQNRAEPHAVQINQRGHAAFREFGRTLISSRM